MKTEKQKEFMKKFLTCKQCGSMNSRFRSETNDYLCRRCGNIWSKSKCKNKKQENNQ